MVEGLRIGANALKEGLRNSLTILGSGEQLGLCSIRQTGYLGQNCRHFRTDEHRGTGSVEWECLSILKQSLIQTPVQFSRDPYVVEMPGRMEICMPYVVYPINSSRVLVRELFYIQIA